MADAISDEELFELYLSNFLKWLDVLTMEPVELCDTWGNYNVAWELVSDLNADGGFECLAGAWIGNYQNAELILNFMPSLRPARTGHEKVPLLRTRRHRRKPPDELNDLLCHVRDPALAG